MSVTAIFLSGGKGVRFGEPLAKQYHELLGQPLAFYSFEQIYRHESIAEVVVVAAAEWHEPFLKYASNLDITKPLQFALPGARRQDSTYNGLKAIQTSPKLILTHDAARPFISKCDLDTVLKASETHAAATLCTPVKATIRKANGERLATETPNRDFLFEILTPQIMNYELLKKGFEIAERENLIVTDDVALVELTGHPIFLIEGPDYNIKITTPRDFVFAKNFAPTFLTT